MPASGALAYDQPNWALAVPVTWPCPSRGRATRHVAVLPVTWPCYPSRGRATRHVAVLPVTCSPKAPKVTFIDSLMEVSTPDLLSKPPRVRIYKSLSEVSVTLAGSPGGHSGPARRVGSAGGYSGPAQRVGHAARHSEPARRPSHHCLALRAGCRANPSGPPFRYLAASAR